MQGLIRTHKHLIICLFVTTERIEEFEFIALGMLCNPRATRDACPATGPNATKNRLLIMEALFIKSLKPELNHGLKAMKDSHFISRNPTS